MTLLSRTILTAMVTTGVGGWVPAAAQSPAATRPIPYPVVAPRTFQDAIERGTRTRSGEPGPAYWQQWSEYELHARLVPDERRVEGSAQIVYHNRSPDPLPFVALQLLQNLHAPGVPRNRPAEVTGGVTIERVIAAGRQLLEEPARGEPGYQVDGTVMIVRPPSPVSPGDSLTLDIAWAFAVPQLGAGGRMGWSRDDMFHIAYWYPVLAVYDDVDGWHTDPFLGGAEFYNGFGDYRLTVEAPVGWVVIATGRLENPEDVLPEAVLQRYRAAHTSDTVVHVLAESDLERGMATRNSDSGMLTWRFRADSVRDVAFSATRASRWDATRTPVGDRNGDGITDYALINALWRPDAPKWSNAWRYAQHSIDFLSRWTGYPYPWPHMTAVEGGGIIGGGMEFPMMTLIGDYNDRSDSALYYVHAHELGHMWFPMMVNVDERRYAWMDEGTTTFNENQARKEFFPGFNHDEPDREDYLETARSGLEGEMMRWSDFQYPGPAYSIASYAKPATLLVTLRGLLGEDVFLNAYHTYVRRWAFKNPKPWDFFNTFNTVTGRNLDWFWRSWYYERWTLDQAVGDVRRTEDGTTVAIEDRGLVPMPARVTITTADGTVLHREIPVDTWLSGATTATLTFPPTVTVTRVEIDAEAAFPDIERNNNIWRQPS